MKPAQELERLCEAWWEKLADSTKGQQHRFTEQFLGLLGWEDPVPIAMEALAARLPALSYILRVPAQDPITAHFLLPGVLDPPGSICERGLDFCPATRQLVDGARAIRARYAFITDMFRSYLYDTTTEELLLFAETPEKFRAEMAEVLHRDAVQHQAIEELRRQPRSHVARQLREWSQRWERTLEVEGGLTQDDAERVIDRLLVLRFVAEHDILRRPGWRLRQHMRALCSGEGELGGRPGKPLITLFHDFWLDFRAQLFEPVPAIDEALEGEGIARRMLSEFGLIASGKFVWMTVLERFNYGDAREKARVRMIPELDEDRSLLFARAKAESADALQIEVDLDEEGYRAIPFWYDKLIELYHRLQKEHAARQAPVAPSDMDLFEWSQEDATAPSALRDPLQHAAEQGLIIYYSSERQLRTARLLLYLDIIQRYARMKARFTRFPGLEQTLQPRPKTLDRERARINAGSSIYPDTWR